MHRIRKAVFKDRLGWDVTVSGELEIDEFDALGPSYLLSTDGHGSVNGCVRLLADDRSEYASRYLSVSCDQGSRALRRSGMGSQPICREREHQRAEVGFHKRPTTC